MMNLFRLPSALVLGGLLMLGACGDKAGDQSGAAGETETAASRASEAGQTIARVNGEEITIQQLNTELATIQTVGQDQKALREEILRAIALRTMLRQAAVKEHLDRRPQVRMLMDSARDKVLAEIYLNAQASSVPPPTSSQVDKFITDNPLQFAERRIYQFQRLTMPADQYREDLVPMFDGKATFNEFQSYLDGKSVPYTLAEVRLASTDFPEEIQEDLVTFVVGDNVVVTGPQSIIILKIEGWVDVPVGEQDAQNVAQNVLHRQSQQERTKSLREQVVNSSKVEFLGEFAGLRLEAPAPAAPARKEGAAPPQGSSPAAPADGSNR